MDFRLVQELSFEEFNMLLDSMKIIKAQDQLKAFDATSYPHADNNMRKKIHKQTSKMAYPVRFKNKVSLDEAFTIFENMNL